MESVVELSVGRALMDMLETTCSSAKRLGMEWR